MSIRSSDGASISGVKKMMPVMITILSLGGCVRIVVAAIISSKTSAGRGWGSADMIVAASITNSTYI